MKKSWFLAVLISLAIIGSAFVVAGNSTALTPQTGTVYATLSYANNGGPVNGSTIATIYTYSGIQVAQEQGAQWSASLNYGSYYVKVSPLYAGAAGIGQVVSGQVTVPLTVSSTSQSVSVNVPYSLLHPVTVKIQGLTSGTATITFSTLSGFAFEKYTTSNGTISNVYLPSGSFVATVSYSGAVYTYNESLTSGQNTLNFELANPNGIYGYVTAPSGAPLSPVNVVVVNESATPYTYQVSHFASSPFHVFSNSSNWANTVLVVTSPGYQPYYINNPTPSTSYSVSLNKSSSMVYYNYTISHNLQTVTQNITYNLGDSTTLPSYFGNATAGSLNLQQILDGITTANGAYANFLANLAQKYTDNFLKVGGYIYNETGTPNVGVEKVASGQNTAQFTGYVNTSYSNSEVPISLYNSDFQISVYALGTQYLPGALEYQYSVTYANSSISLKTSTAAVQTEISPIVISPVSSNQWVTLTMSKSQPPAFVDSQIALNWNGMVSSNYVLNSSATNTAFVVPTNTPVSLNLSNAYFNPVTGQKDYLNPNNNFTWKVGSTVIGYSYNITHTFTTSQTVTIDVTSASGVSNTTSFMVYVNNANPSVKYSVLLGGKTVASGTSATASVSVPQSALVTFSAYGSSSTVGGYQIPLTYAWSFPGFASAALNATHSFSVPSISAGVQSGTLTVTSVTGQSATTTFAVTVNDTTPSNAVISLYNLNNTAVTSPTVGKGTIFSANSTTDPYYSLSTQSYNWTVLYQNGTHAVEGSTTYNVVGGSLNNSSYVILKFNTVDSMVVSLKVTNPAGVVAYNNKTVSMVVDSPRLVVNSVYIGHNLTQGSKATVYVNISNVGTQDAPSFQITLYINNNVVATNTYNNLSAGQSKNVSFSWTPSNSGSVTLEFRGNTSLEPASFPAIGSYTTTVNIKPPAYTTALIIGGVIAVIVIVGFIYYRLSSGRTRKPKQKPAAKQPKQKTEPKKTPEKKK